MTKRYYIDTSERLHNLTESIDFGVRDRKGRVVGVAVNIQRITDAA